MNYGHRYLLGIPDDEKDQNNSIAITSFDWKWWYWKRAAKAAYVARYCPKDWKFEHPGEPCEATKRRYRMKCAEPSAGETGGGRWEGVKCWGERRSLMCTPVSSSFRSLLKCLLRCACSNVCADVHVVACACTLLAHMS